MQSIMKKITILSALVLAFVACTPKELAPAATVQTITLRASVQDATKTVLVDNGDRTYNVNWTSTDAINVNGEASTGIVVSGTDAREATFTLPVVDVPYVAVYPASAYSSGYTAAADTETPATMKVTLPAVQNYVADGFDPAAAILLGKGDAALAFNHAMAYLKITVTGAADTDAIKSIRVQANNGAAMSGQFTATFGDIPALSGGVAYSDVTLNCGSGVAQGDPMYIAIPAATYASGINLLIIDTADHFMTVRSTASFTAIAGKVYPTSVAFNPSTESPVAGGIYTVADWAAFAKSVSDGYDYAGETVTIMNDLTVDTHFAYADGTFNGTLEGGNHTLTANGNIWPLINTLGTSGVVQNVNIDGSFASMANSPQAGNATIAKVNLGLIDNCVNYASTEVTINTACIVGVICAQNGGELRNCKNYGNMTIHHNATANVGLYGGGLAALGHVVLGNSTPTSVDADESCPAGKFTNCENHGNIFLEVKGKYAMKSAVGGICGQVYHNGVVFDGCKNYGAITRISNGEETSNMATTVGGILGRSCAWYTAGSGSTGALGFDKGYDTKIIDCRNEGTIKTFCRHSGGVTNSSTGARVDAAGGIVGAIVGISGSVPTISGCTNTGTVQGGWNTSVNTAVLGGLAGLATYTNISSSHSDCILESVDNTAVGAAGGLVGFALQSVNIENSIAESDIDVYRKSGSAILPGLLIGNVVTSAAFTSCQVCGSISVGGSSLGVNSSNFSNYVVSSNPTASKVTPSTASVTWYVAP